METIEVLGDLNSRIAFQKKWRQITSFSYFTGASLSVIAAATATVVAGLGYAAAAAVVAAPGETRATGTRSSRGCPLPLGSCIFSHRT